MILSRLPDRMQTPVSALREVKDDVTYFIHPFNGIYSNGTYQQNVVFDFMRMFS